MQNSRNCKNPTVIAWEELRLMFLSFSDRMKQYDNMTERQGRDIGIDEVYNEIQNVRQQLDKIQNGLNLYNNNNERKYDKSQPEIPFSVKDVRNREDEAIRRTKVRLTESQLRGVIRQCVNEVLNEVKYAGQSLHGTNPEDWWAVGYLRGHEGQMDKEKKDMNNAKSVELSYDNIAKLTRLPQAKKDYLENYDKQLVDNNKELFKKARTACSYYGNVGKWTRINWFKTAIKAGLPKQDRIRLWKYAQRKNNERYGIA